MLPIPATSRWPSSAWPSSISGAIARMRPMTAAGSKSSASTSGPEAREPWIAAKLRLGRDPDRRSTEVDGLGTVSRQRDPGLRARPAPALTLAIELPAAAHAQVAVEHEVRFEVKEQVLATAFDPLERQAVDRGGREPLRAAPARRSDRDPACLRARSPSAARCGGWSHPPGAIVACGHPAQRQLARLAAEAGFDQGRLHAGADHRLAVDALDRELLDLAGLRRLGQRARGTR